MLSHRDRGRIAASAEPTEKMRDTVIPAMMQPLIEAGFADLDDKAVALLAEREFSQASLALSSA